MKNVPPVAGKRMNPDELIRMFVEQPKGMLSDLPHNPINLEEKVKEVQKQLRKERRFLLKDFERGYTIQTYSIAPRQYVTLIMEENYRSQCFSTRTYETLDSLHTHSLREAIQLHYDAVGHYSKRL